MVKTKRGRSTPSQIVDDPGNDIPGAPEIDSAPPDPRVAAASAAIEEGAAERHREQAEDIGKLVTANCLVVDVPTGRVRRAADLVSLVLNLAAIGVVVLFAAVAGNFTHGVTQDVQTAVTVVLRQILLVPVNIFEGLLTTFVPLLILVELLLRARRRTASIAVVAGCLGAGAALGLDWLFTEYAPDFVLANLTITNDGVTVPTINAALAAVTAILTGVGDRERHLTVRWSWYLLILVVVLSVVRGATTLPAAIITVLLGRTIGHLVRFIDGVEPSRATDISLVKAIRRAGIDVCRLVRVDADMTEARADWVTTPARLGAIPGTKTLPTDAHDTIIEGGAPAPLVDIPAAVAEATPAEIPHLHVPVARIYASWDAAGVRRDVVVLDGDREVVGFLRQLWDKLRLQGLRTAPAATLLETANHAILMTAAARKAGIHTPGVAGIAPVEGSIVLIMEHPPPLARLDALPPETTPDAVADQLWRELHHAHKAGLAHRSLDYNSVGLAADGHLWVTDWNAGETATNDLARRIDMAQALTLLAAYLGEEVALRSAARALPTERLAALAPVLQRIALPRSTQQAAGKDTLHILREALVGLMPAGDPGAAPVRLARFSGKSILMASLGVAAVWAVLGSLNFSEVVQVMKTADPLWILIAFGIACLNFVGAGLALEAFSIKRLGMWHSIEVQVAASLVTLVAPAGVGHAALNLRFVMRKGETTPQAITTVGLVQVAQFVVTIVFLAALALATGDIGTLSLPSYTVMTAIGAVAVLGGLVMLIRPVREWIWRLTGPTLKQVWPRLVWVAGNPGRLARGLFGNFLLTAAFVGALQACLAAFGHTLPITTIAIGYLASNALGSVVPSPGGVGPVEAALTGALTLAGIPPGVAVSTAFAFRFVTLWGRVPLGWLALRDMQRKSLV